MFDHSLLFKIIFAIPTYEYFHLCLYHFLGIAPLFNTLYLCSRIKTIKTVKE